MTHIVEKSGTFQSKDKTRSVQLVEGAQISDEDAVDFGLMTEKEAAKAAEEAATPTAAPEPTTRNKGAAPENRSA